MGKLKLDLDALEVQSFEVDGEPAGRRGTVKGHQEQCTNYDSCWCPTGEGRCTVEFTQHSCQSNIIACPIFYSDQGSCQGTCYYTDAASCGFDCTIFAGC